MFTLLAGSLLAWLVINPAIAVPGIALTFSALFLMYALKYYVSVGQVLRWSNGVPNGNGNNGLGHNELSSEIRRYPSLRPFISIHLPVYNEPVVIDRLLQACTSLDYPNYEVIVADDSTDETTLIIKTRWASHPKVKLSRRENRSGFKGGALNQALMLADPRTEFIAVFDADFIPPPDILYQFLAYFYGRNGANAEARGVGRLVDERLAAVQGYQWHVLNASENWIAKGIRTEYSGSYVIERSSQELGGALKMIAGSVFMIRADVLKRYGWGTSITEDWELTLNLYLDGYKVLYSPFVQAPAECVADFHQLARQRMRWAEGHTFNVKKFFFRVLTSTKMSLREKLEFIYYVPYYLQSIFFLVGTGAWLVSELILKSHLPFWSETMGWSLVFTNAAALILVNLTGLFIERGLRQGWGGLFSFVLLSFMLAPYQAYAALKGLVEPHEGGWHRTQKTGVITEMIERLDFGRRLKRLLPKKIHRRSELGKRFALHASRLMQRLPQPARRILRRTGLRQVLATGFVIVVIILGFFTRFILTAFAAPDLFYLRDTTTNGASPAGEDMSSLQGSSEDTMLFDDVSDEAYWYSELTYPNGGDDAVIPAGSYELNMYFDEVSSSWYDPDWACRKRITIDPAEVEGDLDDFPVLISFSSDSDLAAGAQDDGDDILFTSSNGTKLDHEIEVFNDSTGELVAWVKSDLSGSLDTDIYMYYCNLSVGSQENKTGVWSNSFNGVWHLRENPALVGTDGIIDSTSYGNHGTDGGSMDASDQVPGRIGLALDFDGVNDEVAIGDPLDGSLDFGTNSFSYSVWVFVTSSAGSYDMPWNKGGSSAFYIGYDFELGANEWWPHISDGSSVINPAFGDEDDFLNQWVHLFAVMDRSADQLLIYANGSYIDQADISSFGSVSTDELATIGRRSDGDHPFRGIIDEVRVSSDARPASWIKTSYNNQSTPSSFYKSVGSEETTSGVDITVSVYDTNATGGDAQEIVTSSTVTINSSTTNPYELDIGSGIEKTFTQADPRRLRVHIDVTAVTGGGSFTLAYDSSANPAYLNTPTMTVADVSPLFLAVVAFIPMLTGLVMKKRRMATRLAMIALSLISVIAIMGGQIVTVLAAPDVFYLRDTTNNGATPAGEDMNDTQGSSENTKVFDSVDDEAYWYTELTYPTGGDDAGIAAGSYSLNMYFDQLPGWWDTSYDYRQNITISTNGTTVPSAYTVSITFNHEALVDAGQSQDDGEDIRITWWNGSGWTELDRFLDPGSSWNDQNTRIWFQTQAQITDPGSDANYDMYYGNVGAVNPPNNPDNVFFHYDGFESGNFNGWDGTQTGSGDTITIATSPVHTGTYAAECYVDNGTNAYVEEFFTPLQAFHTTYWLYLPAAYTANDWISSVMYYSELNNQIADLKIWGETPPGSDDLKPYIQNQMAPGAYYSDTPLTTGVWHRLEIKIIVSATSGRAELWVDGVKKVDESNINTGTENIESNKVGIFWSPSGSGEETIYIDDAFDRLWVDPEPSVALGGPVGEPSVEITVSVYDTNATGGTPHEIKTSSTVIIDGSTTDPYELDIGLGAEQTFTSSDPRRLRVHIDVTGVNNGGSFTLAYDSAANPSYLSTPVVTVPEASLLMLLVVIFIPVYINMVERRRRLGCG